MVREMEFDTELFCNFLKSYSPSACGRGRWRPHKILNTLKEISVYTCSEILLLNFMFNLVYSVDREALIVKPPVHAILMTWSIFL